MRKDVYRMDNDSIIHLLEREYGFSPATGMQSVVLVGGKGTRLDESRKLIRAEDYPKMNPEFQDEIGPKGMALMTCNTPSGIRQRPLTDWHLDIHAQIPQIKKITLGLGCRADIMIDYYERVHQTHFRGIPMEFLVEEHPAGTLAPIIKLLEKNALPEDPIVFANGDNLMDIDFHRAYLIGCYFILQQHIQPNDAVIDIIALVPWEESSAYGTIDYEFKTGIARKFKEKGPVAQNPHTNINGRNLTPINSGFSIIPNPKWLFGKNISNSVIEISHQLEQGKLDYKQNEAFVKYETLYEKIAADGKLFGVYFENYWTDLGTEEKIIAAERDFAGTGVVKKFFS
ncbi:NDP-sugar synthase [candidate division KSB1 bacterium]|nr:NDP-sugar synthase [candidate division KSB1 bacterium]